MNNEKGNKEASNRPRGRPKSEAKHSEILSAAGGCFLENGLSATSMDQVAQRAGVSKQTIYSHFNSKDELFQAVIKTKCAGHQLDEDTLDPRDLSLEEGFYRLTRRYLELALDPQLIAMHRQVAAQSIHSTGMARLFVDAGPRRTIERVARFLAAHQQAGRLVDADPELLASDYVHETGARFKFELMMGLRSRIPEAEVQAHARRRVREFLSTYAADSADSG